MIGQRSLHEQIQNLIKSNSFPRFSIFVGVRGSEKTELAHEVACDLRALIYDCGTKVDDIRNMITDAYKVHEKMCYIISDADGMSLAAKNALLKVTEEPPNNAYFIMTLEDENNTLETIRSRGTVFHMDRYTPNEIIQYITEKYGSTAEDNVDIFRSICDTPGDADILVKCGVKSFYEYVQLVADNIAEVSLPNAFKIAQKIAFKEDSEGYDLRLFWKAFIHECVIQQKYEAVAPTSQYLQKLRIKGINSSMLFDCWVLEIRKLWMLEH